MSIKPFNQRLIEDRRLWLLRLLAEQCGQTANSSVLHMGLHHLGMMCEQHEVVGDLRHLQVHGLVMLEQVVDTIYVAHLQGRGEDVVAGIVQVDGVSRPRRGV